MLCGVRYYRKYQLVNHKEKKHGIKRDTTDTKKPKPKPLNPDSSFDDAETTGGNLEYLMQHLSIEEQQTMSCEARRKLKQYRKR